MTISLWLHRGHMLPMATRQLTLALDNADATEGDARKVLGFCVPPHFASGLRIVSQAPDREMTANKQHRSNPTERAVD